MPEPKLKAVGVLDPAARGVVDRLHAQAARQRARVIRHYLPRLPSWLFGQPLQRPGDDMRFFDDKLIPIDAGQGELLYLLARARSPQLVVEFGTSFGVSTLYLTAAVRDSGAGGRVVGTELVSAKAAAARRNLTGAGLAEFAEIRTGDARETLRDLDKPVDLLLLDGWPRLADEILALVTPRLAQDAMVVVDNISQFPRELAPVVQRLSNPPFRVARLPLNGATLVGVRA